MSETVKFVLRDSVCGKRWGGGGALKFIGLPSLISLVIFESDSWSGTSLALHFPGNSYNAKHSPRNKK